MDNLNLPENVTVAKKLIESNNELEKLKLEHQQEKSKQERGSLGKLFGSGNSISKNIAGLLICTLLAVAVVYTFIMLFKGQEVNDLSIKDFWSVILPLVTLTIGYLFGKGSE